LRHHGDLDEAHDWNINSPESETLADVEEAVKELVLPGAVLKYRDSAVREEFSE